MALTQLVHFPSGTHPNNPTGVVQGGHTVSAPASSYSTGGIQFHAPGRVGQTAASEIIGLVGSGAHAPSGGIGQIPGTVPTIVPAVPNLDSQTANSGASTTTSTSTTAPGSGSDGDPYDALAALLGAGSTDTSSTPIVGLPVQQNASTGSAGPNVKLIGVIAVTVAAVLYWLWKTGKLKKVGL